MMLMTGLGLLGAAMTAPNAWAQPVPPGVPGQPPPPPGLPVPPPAVPDQAPLPAQPPGGTVAGPLLFSDEFDGPPGAAPDRSKWIVQSWQDPVNPPLLGTFRDDRRNVFLDGNSNLVLLATKEGNEVGKGYFGGRVRSIWQGRLGTTWEARIKLDCLTPGAWPAFWTVNEQPLPDGEVDIMEWYGNGKWPAGTTVHAASNGKTWEGMSIPGLVDNGWHNWRMYWGVDGFQFWRDYTDGAKPYFSVPAKPIPVSGRPGDMRWPFANPDYPMMAVLNVAVGGPGGGNPDAGRFPAAMLVDWIRVW